MPVLWRIIWNNRTLPETLRERHLGKKEPSRTNQADDLMSLKLPLEVQTKYNESKRI